MKKVQKCVPLDERIVTVLNFNTDELEEVSPLHPNMCKYSISSNLYQKISINTDEDVEQYCSLLDEILTSLNWVLSLEYERFWCQVINDQAIHTCLDSYLRLAPRYCQPEWPEELNEKHSHVHRSVFMIFLRMSTSKESNEHFMTKKYFSKLVYDNYLFDIPRIMDLCSLFGVPDNRALLKKMIESLFHNQPSFFVDLSQAAATVSKVLSQIAEKCLGNYASGMAPNKLDAGLSPLHRISETDFSDIIYYISDTTKTLQSFVVEVFTEASETFYKHNLIEDLVMLYTDVIPPLQEVLIDKERTLGGELYFQLRCHLHRSCESLMDIINGLLKNIAYLPAIQAAEQNENEKTEELIEKYFHVLSHLLTNQRFFEDFCKKFDTKSDVQTLTKVCPNVAEAHSRFLFDDLFGHDGASPTASHSHSSIPTDVSISDDQPCTSKSASAASYSGDIESVKMSSLVSTILDVLPDLEEDFIRKCLTYYEMDPQKVIQAVLEENLPPHIYNNYSKESDPVSSTSHPGPFKQEKTSQQKSLAKTTDVLRERKNIFDDDEFDVFSKGSNVDKSRIHYGKRDKDQVKHWKEDADDEVEKLRLLYSQYGLGGNYVDNDEFLISENPISNYEDEYDDTYDYADVAANDADSVDELGGDEEDTKKEEEKKPRSPYKHRRFADNPETMRTKELERNRRREEYFASRGGKASKHHPSRSNRSNQSVPGEGGSTDTNAEKKRREQKNSRGGYNRKTMAAKKTGKGMFMGR